MYGIKYVFQTDYYKILNDGETNQMRYEDEDGAVVLVTETETSSKDQGHKVFEKFILSLDHLGIVKVIYWYKYLTVQFLQCLKIIRGTEQKLLEHLTEDTPVMHGEPFHSFNTINDPCYVEDFLLTHRTFISSTKVMEHLLSLMQKGTGALDRVNLDNQKDKVARVILLWVRNSSERENSQKNDRASKVRR